MTARKILTCLGPAPFIRGNRNFVRCRCLMSYRRMCVSS